MSINHYENFPVASFLLPSYLQPAVKAIYMFARSADDLADEGDASPETRLRALSSYECSLDSIENRQPCASPLFSTLAKTIEEYRLPIQPFRDLLSAFKQDVTTLRYATFDQLKDYCSRSANPVGMLMLYLYNAVNRQNLQDSDAICSALQLINFWQDIAIDWEKKRIYLPEEDMQRFGVTPEHIAHAHVDDAWRKLMRFETGRARAMLISGASLALRLPGRIGWELRMVIQGGLRILERIEAVDYDVFNCRPTLQPVDWLLMTWRTMTMKIRLSSMAQVG